MKNIEHKLDDANKYTKNLETKCDSLKQALKKEKVEKLKKLSENDRYCTFYRIFEDKIKKYGWDFEKWPYSAFGIE